MLSLVSFAGMTLNKCAVLWIGTLKKVKKSLPTLLKFFGVLTLNTHIFLFGPTKHAKHFEKMAELTYAELPQGRESTRLPHTHRFASLKNVVISALHKTDK